jgi:hypothetical protein
LIEHGLHSSPIKAIDELAPLQPAINRQKSHRVNGCHPSSSPPNMHGAYRASVALKVIKTYHNFKGLTVRLPRPSASRVTILFRNFLLGMSANRRNNGVLEACFFIPTAVTSRSRKAPAMSCAKVLPSSFKLSRYPFFISVLVNLLVL